jgi:hypothetical protein
VCAYSHARVEATPEERRFGASPPQRPLAVPEGRSDARVITCESGTARVL